MHRENLHIFNHTFSFLSFGLQFQLPQLFQIKVVEHNFFIFGSQKFKLCGEGSHHNLIPTMHICLNGVTRLLSVNILTQPIEPIQFSHYLSLFKYAISPSTLNVVIILDCSHLYVENYFAEILHVKLYGCHVHVLVVSGVSTSCCVTSLL